MDGVISFGALLLLGYIASKAANLLNLPGVSGYLIVGLIVAHTPLAPLITNLGHVIESIEVMALSIIGLSIGLELEYRYLKRIGPKVLVLTTIQVLVTFFAVSTAIFLLAGQPLSLAILLGGISTATAPAATILVLKECRAKGPLASTLVPVIAIDDIFCVLMFGMATVVTKLIQAHGTTGTLLSVGLSTAWEILGSIVIGVVLGIVATKLVPKLRNQADLMIVVLGIALLGGELAGHLHLSLFILVISMGIVLANLSGGKRRIEKMIDLISPPLYVVFFVVVGGTLQLSFLTQVGTVGIAYIVARSAGKIIGGGLGAAATGSEPQVRKYLGISLLPQAGVAVGLAVLVKQSYPELGVSIVTVVLASTVVFELIGPIATRIALRCAGEMPAKRQRRSAVSKASPEKPSIQA